MAESDFQKEPPEPSKRPRRSQDAQREPSEERPRRKPRRRDDEDEDDWEEAPIRRNDPVEMLIPYRNAQGLVAYYLGVFSWIPCVGLLLGPAAVIVGILGLRYSKRHPKAGGAGHAITGIVLGLITGLANWGFLIFMLTAVIMGARSR